jgi:hypothetical protein
VPVAPPLVLLAPALALRLCPPLALGGALALGCVLPVEKPLGV